MKVIDNCLISNRIVINSKNDGNLEEIMDFKRKIALIILVGLLASLFGSFSFLMGMESAVITDFNGQIVQLDSDQRAALDHCETLKHMIQDMKAKEIPFEGVAPFITYQNFQHLAQLITDKAYLNQIAQDQDCLELFKLADYMNAPKETLSLLADRIYESLRKKIKETVNEDEKANLELLCETVETNLDYYPDFSSLIKNRPDLEKLGIKNSIRPSRFSLDFKTLGKKLRSLEGIEELVGNEWPNHKTVLGIGSHDISKVNFAQIRKAFPAVSHILLKDNQLRHISNINASDVTIDLTKNPIELITIDNPRSLKNTKIVIDKDARPVVTFNQSRLDKCAQWLEALRAQGSVAVRRPNMLKECMFSAAELAIKSFLVNGAIWFYDMYTAGKSFNSEALRSFTKSQLFVITAASTISPSWTCLNKMLNEQNQIRQELAQLAHADGDHVSVCWTEPYNNGNTRTVITHLCPSKYAYNLFGKN